MTVYLLHLYFEGNHKVWRVYSREADAKRHAEIINKSVEENPLIMEGTNAFVQPAEVAQHLSARPMAIMSK